MEFYKFDGAGNDFVVIDNRSGACNLSREQIALMCHRRFGIGADGLMLLEECRPPQIGCQFEMKYYNSDGGLGSMCGNGGRCIAMFAHLLGMGTHLHFRAFDGDHDALIVSWDAATSRGIVDLGMREVPRAAMHQLQGGWFLDTGSPHFVLPVSDLEHFDVVGEGRRLRYRDDLFPQGANIDFIENLPDGRLFVRTYERGVEDETWACGTGVTACAIVSGNHRLVTRGGDFSVSFSASETCFANIRLVGPVSLNFKGLWTSSAR